MVQRYKKFLKYRNVSTINFHSVGILTKDTLCLSLKYVDSF